MPLKSGAWKAAEKQKFLLNSKQTWIEASNDLQSKYL